MSDNISSPAQDQRRSTALIFDELCASFREPTSTATANYRLGLARALRYITGTPEHGWLHAAEAQARRDGESGA